MKPRIARAFRSVGAGLSFLLPWYSGRGWRWGFGANGIEHKIGPHPYPPPAYQRRGKERFPIFHRALLLVASIALAIALLAAPAFAHAFLDHSEPRVGATISNAPKELKIWFTQQPEPAFSAIAVFNSDGKQIDAKDTHPDDKDAKELIVSLPDLSPGTYKVMWHVLSVDTHKTQGDFKFTVQP